MTSSAVEERGASSRFSVTLGTGFFAVTCVGRRRWRLRNGGIIPGILALNNEYYWLHILFTHVLVVVLVPCDALYIPHQPPITF